MVDPTYLNPHQSAYCKHHSTEPALLYIHDHLIDAIGSQKVSCLCLLHFVSYLIFCRASALSVHYVPTPLVLTITFRYFRIIPGWPGADVLPEGNAWWLLPQTITVWYELRKIKRCANKQPSVVHVSQSPPEMTWCGSLTSGQASMWWSNWSDGLSEHPLDEQLGPCSAARCWRLSALKQRL